MAKYIAKIGKKGNIKLGSHTATFSKLYSNKEIYINDVLGSVKGSCGHYCKGCENDCYVKKSYRYTSVKVGHATNTIAIREQIKQAFIDINLQIQRSKKHIDFFRINQSGELESVFEFLAWCNTARQNPDTKFWVYSKAYDIIIPVLLSGVVPNNLTVLISVWHDIGLNEYNAVKHLENVKAFVYVDGNKGTDGAWNENDYRAHDLDITTYCKAYDEKGKLNHDITCERCQKCFNRLETSKVIGCLAH